MSNFRVRNKPRGYIRKFNSISNKTKSINKPSKQSRRGGIKL